MKGITVLAPKPEAARVINAIQSVFTLKRKPREIPGQRDGVTKWGAPQ